MLKITDIYVDGQKPEIYEICSGSSLMLSWAAASDIAASAQASADVKITQNGKTVWAKVVKGSKQSVTASASALTNGYFTVTVSLTSDRGEYNEAKTSEFFYARLEDGMSEWIAADEETEQRSIIFQKSFTSNKEIKSAFALVCGLGYHELYINGAKQGCNVMSPATSDYRKTCYVEALPSLNNFVTGENRISVKVGCGWRKLVSDFVKQNAGGIRFSGEPCLFCCVDITYTDGSVQRISADGSWSYRLGYETFNDIYNGETYDANACDYALRPVKLTDCPGEKLLVSVIPPIKELKAYPAQTVYSPAEGVYVIDFGQNIAGVTRIRLPKLDRGDTITVTCHEMLDDDGSLYIATLRGARCTDTYIASGDENDLSVWQPTFTYHGFRYIQVRGWKGVPDLEDFTAVQLGTSVRNDSFFSCGSAILNAVQHNVVMTEQDNIHSILTDCPQRDERLGWMNDATVRFTETPYNFNVARLFPKVIQDLLDVQENGAIRCTAPFVFGGNPADPVCSSYLVAGYESYRMTGDKRILELGYDGWCAWENLLLDRHNEDEPYIVNYSYYGDWAGPAYACIGEDGANSSVTPGIFMSSGFSYYNCTLLSFFASELGRSDEASAWAEKAELVKAAVLKKWWDDDKAVMASGSEACQAFALKLGIIPEDRRDAAAKVLRDDLVSRDYKFTTGNLCTLYMLEMLTKYGYTDEAYELMTKETYPSYGFMIQNEATTVWERFELKKNPGMNSYNHPMFGSAGKWLYSGICGLSLDCADNSKVIVDLPSTPEKLLSASCSFDTLHGDVTVRWVKRFGKKTLYLGIPFGMTASVNWLGNTRELASGWHLIEA